MDAPDSLATSARLDGGVSRRVKMTIRPKNLPNPKPMFACAKVLVQLVWLTALRSPVRSGASCSSKARARQGKEAGLRYIAH